MYNRGAAGSHLLMTSQIKINSALAKTVEWIERRRCVALAVVAILLAVQITPKLTMSPDGVSYMSVARHLLLHGTLERLGSPHVRYAPGYPVVISPAFWFGPRPFVEVQIIQWLCAVLLIAGTYAWFARYAGKSAIWVTALAILNAGFWDLFRQASSELVFMPCVMWASVLLAAAADSRRASRAAAMTAAAIVLVAAACATRQVGALLAVGFTIALAIRAARGRIGWGRAVACSAAVGIGVVAVSCGLIAFDRQGAHKAGPAEIGYTDAFRQPGKYPAAQVAEGVRRQTAEIGRLLLPGLWKTHAREGDWRDINTWIFLAACVPVAIGWWKLSKTTADPLALTFPFYVAIYAVYPFDSGTRFTVPMLPVLAASIWFVLSPLAGKRGWIFLILVAAQAGVAIGFWLDDAAHVRRRWGQWTQMERVAAAIPPGANIIALRGSAGDDWMFLMYLSDRAVAPESMSQPVTSIADWMVTSRTEPDWPGFYAVGQVDNYKLERRVISRGEGQPDALGRKGD
jgi:hypothetical protein